MSGAVVTASLLREPPPRKHAEESECRALARFLRFAMPADGTWTHIPLGGKRHNRVGKMLAGMGAHAGWPDYIVCWRGITVFVEMKTATGALSTVQRQVHEKLRYCGFRIFVCRNVPDVETALRSVGIPLKASAL